MAAVCNQYFFPCLSKLCYNLSPRPQKDSPGPGLRCKEFSQFICPIYTILANNSISLSMDHTYRITFTEAQVSSTQRKLAKCWRQYFARKQRFLGRTLIRVFYPTPLTAKSPELVGTFTSPAWGEKLQMSYSMRAKGYVREVWMSAQDMFQIFHFSQCILLPEFLPSQYHRVNGERCMLTARSAGQYKEFIRYYARKNKSKPILRFQAASSVFPKAGKRIEDAHFLESNMLGVADGVGGWRALGVDSGLFASELMQECRAQTVSSWSLVLSPKSDETCRAVQESYLIPVAEEALARTQACGSSTLLLCALNTGQLEVLNLGDSRAMLIRMHHGKPQVMTSTTPMQHSFNCPYQLSKPLSAASRTELIQHCPPSNRKELQRALNSRKLINDQVRTGDIYTLSVIEGDLLIAGSDGLWDNLFEEEILACVGENQSAEEIARKLAKAAHMKSLGKGKTPFEVEALLAHGLGAWRGGKEDDISVIVAWIRE